LVSSPAWLRAAGLMEIRRQTTLIERAAPLPAISLEHSRKFLIFAANRYGDLDVPDEDRAFWRSLREPEAVDRLLNDADFYFGEGNTLVVGRVPER